MFCRPFFRENYSALLKKMFKNLPLDSKKKKGQNSEKILSFLIFSTYFIEVLSLRPWDHQTSCVFGTQPPIVPKIFLYCKISKPAIILSVIFFDLKNSPFSLILCQHAWDVNLNS